MKHSFARAFQPFGLLLLLTLSTFGCRQAGAPLSDGTPSSNVPNFTSGIYDGILLKIDSRGSEETFVNGSLSIHAPAPTVPGKVSDSQHPSDSQRPPAQTSKGNDDSRFHLSGEFSDDKRATFSLEAQMTFISSTPVLTLSASGLVDGTFIGSWDDTKACFLSMPKSKVSGEVCIGAADVTVEFHPSSDETIQLALNPRSVTDAERKPVKPAPYTVNQLLNLAKSRSFESRTQFDTAEISRENALTAKGNLLPHFGLNDLLGLMTFSVTSMIKSVGNLVPFLLPSRWIDARQKANQSNADRYAYLIMKADSANTAEGLGLAVLRDMRSIDVLSSYMHPITILRDQLQHGEMLGTEEPGSAATVTTVLNDLNVSKQALQSSVADGRVTLAQAVGYTDPNAISEVLPSLTVKFNAAPKVDVKSTQSLVLERSLEMRQINSLLNVADEKSNGRRYYWLDPTGDGTTLGAGLPSSIRAGIDSVKVVSDQRDQLRATLLQRLQLTLNEIDDSVTQYRQALNSLALQKDRISQIQNGLLLGKPVSAIELQNAYQTALRYETTRDNAEFQYYISYGKLNRLLYVGDYADLLNEAKTIH